MIPLYGFLQGDTIGLIVLSREDEPIGELAAKLQAAARVRVAPRESVQVVYDGRVLDPLSTVGQVGLTALARFDVVEKTEKLG